MAFRIISSVAQPPLAAKRTRTSATLARDRQQRVEVGRSRLPAKCGRWLKLPQAVVQRRWRDAPMTDQVLRRYRTATIAVNNASTRRLHSDSVGMAVSAVATTTSKRHPKTGGRRSARIVDKAMRRGNRGIVCPRQAHASYQPDLFLARTERIRVSRLDRGAHVVQRHMRIGFRLRGRRTARFGARRAIV